MPTTVYFRIAGILAVVAVATILLTTWRANRRDYAQLAASLSIAQQSLAQANARQHDRDKQLLQTLATLAAEKRNITAPAQILRALPQEIPLPVPITTADSAKTESPVARGSRLSDALDSLRPRSKTTNGSSANQAAPTQAILPTEDLKPLYDFAINCKACLAKLAAAQADLTDERAKTAILTRERDAALHVAKGGCALRRIARNAKWLAIGALA